MALLENETACPEKRLLVCCARMRMRPAIGEEIRRIANGPLDWDYVLNSAAENSVMPLIGLHFAPILGEIVPAEWIERVKGACRANALRCLLLTGELIRIVNHLEGNQVKAIPYKGPVLAVQAYGDITLREYEDLDLIICQRDLGKAHEVMLSLGFRPRFPWIHSSGYSGATASVIPGEYNYVDDARRIIVELHTELTLRHFPMTPDLEELSQRLVPVSLSGHPVKTFSPEDNLSALCIHGAKDMWERISWVTDISELIQAGKGLDWDAVWKRAEALRAERMVSLGLALAADLLDAPLPEEVRSHVKRDEVATGVAQELKTKLLQRNPQRLSGAARFQYRRRMVVGALRGWRYSTRLAMAPAEEDWETVRLPRALAPIYIALRPFRLLRKYGWTRRDSGQLPS
jgi:Uncharacterised nucleotidyltransferase